MKRVFIRNIQAGDFLEVFLITAVASLIVIRFFLFLTGYPTLGGEEFHIAHMLWGGFFMMVAIVILLTYLNSSVLWVAAVLGGIGFGTFIDELGKFITRDNNYFYEPSIAIIYIIFVLLFLYFRSIEKRTRFSKKEYLINALELMEDVALADLDIVEKEKLLRFLKKSDQDNPIVKALQRAVSDIEHIKPQNASFFQVTVDFLKHIYKMLIQNSWFPKLVILVFLANFFITVFLIGKAVYFVIDEWATPFAFLYSEFSFTRSAETVFSTLSGIFTIIGVIYMYRSRITAYYWFKRSLLVSIFLTQFFLFYKDQLSAIAVLTMNIVLFTALQYMIYEEELVEKRD